MPHMVLVCAHFAVNRMCGNFVQFVSLAGYTHRGEKRAEIDSAYGTI